MNNQTALWGLLYVNGMLLAGIAGVVVVGVNQTQPNSSIHKNGTVLSSTDNVVQTAYTLAPYIPSGKEYEAITENISTYSRPALNLLYKTPHEQKSFVFEPEVIASFYTTEVTTHELYVVLDTDIIKQHVANIAQEFNRNSTYEYASKEYSSVDRVLNEEPLVQTLISEFVARMNGTVKAEIVITEYIDESPATKGDISDMYLEVDKSQQKLYLWENKKIAGTYVISTGLSGPTPNGTHHIINHASNAWSPIANVWTPYWMAFAFNSDAHAWLGFHELPYWDGANGEKIRRSFDTLGKPATGGCIQMDIGDAKKVFDWAKDSMIVLIHD